MGEPCIPPIFKQTRPIPYVWRPFPKQLKHIPLGEHIACNDTVTSRGFRNGGIQDAV